MNSTRQENQKPDLYAWGTLSRNNLHAAGVNRGYYRVPASEARAYTDTLVDAGCALWVEDDLIRLTPLGWNTFYELSGNTRDRWSETHQNGIDMRTARLVVFTHPDLTVPRRCLVAEPVDGDWEAAARKGYALHPEAGFVFIGTDAPEGPR